MAGALRRRNERRVIGQRKRAKQECDLDWKPTSVVVLEGGAASQTAPWGYSP